jgi:glycosyltransferase involved in cell wall biosynthesis
VGTWWRAVRGGELPQELAWRAECTRRGLLGAEAVLAPSRSFAAELAAYYGLQRSIRVVTNGTRLGAMPRSPRPHALTAGRLWDEGKNIPVLDAAAGLSGVRVRAAGPVTGPNGAAVSPRNLHLLGNLSPTGLAGEYAQAAVFVSVARYEPFGLAVLEAAQAGCALLLSDIPSFRELWDDAAQFVDASDPICIAGALRALVAAPAQCGQLGQFAQERSARHGPEAMTAATWAVHCELVT